MSDTLERVKTILRDHLAFGEDFAISETTRLTQDLQADSLDLVELEMALEEEFDIETDDDLNAESTVADVVNLVETKGGK